MVVLPYIQGVTERITRILAPHAKVANKPGKNLRNMLVRPKNQREKTSNAGLVYQYECECKKVYIGESGRSLKTRESEHKRAIRNGDENHSGISKHVLETGHSIMWEKVKILAYEANWRKRKIKEGIFIAKTNCRRSAKHKTGRSNEQRLSCALVLSVSGVANLYTDLPALLLGGANGEKKRVLCFEMCVVFFY